MAAIRHTATDRVQNREAAIASVFCLVVFGARFIFRHGFALAARRAASLNMGRGVTAGWSTNVLLAAGDSFALIGQCIQSLEGGAWDAVGALIRRCIFVPQVVALEQLDQLALVVDGLDARVAW